ncbi:MAG: dienelactone hydrolase family protein [Candidatus Binataceae bacterium]|nr:dienelactone hydrolase family protein [Candidatus Binataceae bacterium]
MPVAGQVTNPESIETKEISYLSDGSPIAAYLARPRRPGSYPGIIVLQEIFGVNEHIRDLARRFAAAGFVALAPELFSRVGRPRAGEAIEETIARAAGLDDRQLIRDVEGAVTALRNQGGVSSKIGTAGFCFGGRLALMFACNSKSPSATVDCWGGNTLFAGPGAPTSPSRPTPVADMVGNLHGALYVVGGAEDQNPSPEHLSQLGERLKQAGKNATVEIFQGAGHAFFADYRPGYNEKAAFDLWPKMISFLKANLA